LSGIDELILADVKVTWEKQCLNQERSNKIIEYNSNIHDYNEVLNLALLSGNFSRFRTDSNFKNNEFYNLYKEWLNKSINKKIADIVFIYQVGEKIVGFITIGKSNAETSHIGLIAVDPSYQGKKIGSDLINVSLNYSTNNNYKKIEVETQKENIPAMRLYEKNSFNIKSIQYIYHLWNK
jgi:dTDP-4-amino-4,6-dideoxy-D-galactose acyltransferase